MKVTLPIFAAALAATSIPAMAAEVLNGSFEVPAVNSVSYANCGTVICTAGAGFEPNGGAFGYAPAPDGNQILHLQNGATATLSLTDLVLGQFYSVSFLAATRPGYGVLPVSLAYDGALIGSFTPSSPAFTAFSGFNFTAAGTTGTLSFLGASGNGDLNTGVDAVSLGAVPEPSTWAMMLLGFGVIGFGLRRRKAAPSGMNYNFS